MGDTQLPRFEVFLQEKEGQPHQDVGSVHASDPEFALLNARDVFVRRPECHSLWVVPVEAIFSKTAEELEGQGLGLLRDKQEDGANALKEPYYLFSKAKSAGTQTLVGEVVAGSAEEAMRQAIQRFSKDRQPFAWWVFPARLVVRSDLKDIESMFAPAWNKPFRLATDYHTLTAMRRIRDNNR